MNKRKRVCTQGKEGGEEKMDIDDSDKISEPTDNVERILDAKEEEFFPDNPEVDDILRRMGEEWEELEEKEKQMYIKRECLSRRIFLREYKCLKINYFRVT